MDNNSMHVRAMPYEIRGEGLFGDAPDARRLQLVVPAIVKQDHFLNCVITREAQ